MKISSLLPTRLMVLTLFACFAAALFISYGGCSLEEEFEKASNKCERIIQEKIEEVKDEYPTDCMTKEDLIAALREIGYNASFISKDETDVGFPPEGFVPPNIPPQIP